MFLMCCTVFASCRSWARFCAVVFSTSLAAQTISVEFRDDGDHVFSDDERATIAKIADDVFAEVSEVLPQVPTSVTLTVSGGFRRHPGNRNARDGTGARSCELDG